MNDVLATLGSDIDLLKLDIWRKNGAAELLTGDLSWLGHIRY